MVNGNINRINNDSLLEHNFKSILSRYFKRIFIGAFSTDLIRIQKIIDLSIAANRKLAIINCNDERIINVAIDANYLKIDEDHFININDYSKEEIAALENVVIIVTGFRIEPYFTLVKMAMGEDERIKFVKNDKVVLMCPPIPGTERQTTDAINRLCEYDTDLSSFDKTVLRSAHASPDDLKLLYNLLKPEYVIPIKGEYRHMYDHLQVALEAGYDRKNVILLDNGEIIEFDDGKLSDSAHEIIPTGDLLVDGSNVGFVDNNVLEERSQLAEEGAIIIYGTVNLRRRMIEGHVEITARGFTHSINEQELNNSFGLTVERILNNSLKKKKWDLNETCEIIEKEVSNLSYRFTKHRPIIIPVICEV